MIRDSEKDTARPKDMHSASDLLHMAHEVVSYF